MCVQLITLVSFSYCSTVMPTILMLYRPLQTGQHFHSNPRLYCKTNDHISRPDHEIQYLHEETTKTTVMVLFHSPSTNTLAAAEDCDEGNNHEGDDDSLLVLSHSLQGSSMTYTGNTRGCGMIESSNRLIGTSSVDRTDTIFSFGSGCITRHDLRLLYTSVVEAYIAHPWLSLRLTK